MTLTLFITAILAAYILLYDVLAISLNRPTITQQIRKASARWPMVPFSLGFIVGLLVGHLFWVNG
jgi:hypothetical protein